MSYYYKYNFISPEPIYATVKEELKSYFDDLLFPTYLDKCLKKLGRTTYVISEEVLFVEDFQARLPDNFHAVREAWMCAEVPGNPYPSATSFYSQAANATTIQISPLTIGGTPCNNFAPPVRQFTPGSSTYDSFDIRDNKFVTNFRNAVVHLLFYSTEYDDTGNQLVPDNYRVVEYIEAFLKFKVFETLTNQTNDETFNQLQQKLAYYKQEYNEKYIEAETEVKKQTPWEKQRRIKKDLNRFNMYELPTRTNRYGSRRRRNN